MSLYEYNIWNHLWKSFLTIYTLACNMSSTFQVQANFDQIIHFNISNYGNDLRFQSIIDTFIHVLEASAIDVIWLTNDTIFAPFIV